MHTNARFKPILPFQLNQFSHYFNLLSETTFMFFPCGRSMSTGLTVVKNTCPTFPTGLFGLLNMMALVLLVNLLASSFSSSFQSWLVTTPSFFVWKLSTKTELKRFKHSFHSNMFILLPCFPIFLILFFFIIPFLCLSTSIFVN